MNISNVLLWGDMVEVSTILALMAHESCIYHGPQRISERGSHALLPSKRKIQILQKKTINLDKNLFYR